MKIQRNRGRGSRRVPTLAAWALAAVLSTPAVVAGAAPGASGTAAETLLGVVNVNTATARELILLPGIGEIRANALIDARKRRGGFEALEDLLEVQGVGKAGLARLRPHVTLRGKTTARAASPGE